MALTIPYVKQSWTDGSGGGTPVSAARLGVLEEGVFDVSYAPAVRVFHNAAQSIANNAFAALNFNSERFDQAGNAASTMHDTVTNNTRLTCRYAGVYQITGNCGFAASATGQRAIRIRLNGTTYISSDSRVNAGAVLIDTTTTTLYPLAVNDYVELMVFQDSGGALNTNLNANYSPEFMMCRAA